MAAVRAEAPVPEPFRGLRRLALQTLQVNLGYRCNQSCSHCHVSAGPSRTEMMEAATVALIPAVLRARAVGCLDLTGGAPELHPQFRSLVHSARALGVDVIDRCNLTILSEPGQDDLAAFLAQEGVTVVASLPCYTAATVDEQRGAGVFARSIAGLRQLNALGYGQPGSGLVLNLVYNPLGPRLPPPQAALERDYKRELLARHGVRFNSLLALTNMPIQRFAAVLRSRGELESYQALLEANHQNANLERVMCRSLISVDWQGGLHDCDFNQMLQLPAAGRRQGLHLRDLLDRDPAGDAIAFGPHCYGCSAGAGSSCGGSLSTSTVSPQP